MIKKLVLVFFAALGFVIFDKVILPRLIGSELEDNALNRIISPYLQEEDTVHTVSEIDVVDNDESYLLNEYVTESTVPIINRVGQRVYNTITSSVKKDLALFKIEE